MSQLEVSKKGSLDLEQPPHVEASTTNDTPPPPQPAPPPQPTVPGYVVAVDRGVAERERLPCCGLGFGWTLFILGFLIGTIPWYAGAVLLCYVIHKKDYREKPGCIACLIAAFIITVLIIVNLATGKPHWL